MPYFAENPLDKLTIAADDAEETLDLSQLSDAEALAAVERLLHAREGKSSYLIRFAAARNDGRETLFLPLGRRLLQARRDGVLSRCLPVSDGAGYFIAFCNDD